MQGSLKDYQEQFHSGKVLGANAFATLAPCPGMRVLDVGCGDGALTVRIAEAGADVVAVDVDQSFIDHAASLGLDARVVDCHKLQFYEEFDAVFSNAALHWMRANPSAVAQGICKALRPGGRFVAEFGGQGNVGVIVDALGRELASRGFNPDERNPWFFPGAEEYAELLTAAGLQVTSCQLVPAPTVLDKELIGWLRTFCNKWLQGIDEASCAAILEAVQEAAASTLKDADGKWTVPYIRIRVTAIKPGIEGEPSSIAPADLSAEPPMKAAKLIEK